MSSINEIALLVDSVERYRYVVEALFSDNIYSHGRLIILAIFSDAVCNNHPNISSDIRNEFCMFLTRFNGLNRDIESNGLNRNIESHSCCIL